MHLSKLNVVSAVQNLLPFSSAVTRISNSSQWNDGEGASTVGPEAVNTMYTANLGLLGWNITTYYWEVGGTKLPSAKTMGTISGLSRRSAKEILNNRVKHDLDMGSSIDNSLAPLPFVTRNVLGQKASNAQHLAVTAR